jgi:hypothetical protein
MVNSAVVFAASIAASGNSGNINIPVPDPLIECHEVRISGKYAAVAGVTGLQVALSTSPDNVTYTAAPGPASQIQSSGTSIGSLTIRVSRDRVSGPINFIRTVVTNLDATNAAVVMVDYLGSKQ